MTSPSPCLRLPPQLVARRLADWVPMYAVAEGQSQHPNWAGDRRGLLAICTICVFSSLRAAVNEGKDALAQKHAKDRCSGQDVWIVWNVR